MFLETKREGEAKTDPFTLTAFIGWLDKQPAEADYAYLCNGHCLLAQYFTAVGFENVHMFADAFWHGKTKCPTSVGQTEMYALRKGAKLPPNFNQIASRYPHNFGSALERARQFAS